MKWKIELKKICFSERMSEETSCFMADIYVDGKKVGYCKNNGRGGCTEIHGYTMADNELFEEIEKYCKGLPKVKVEEMNFEYNQTLEHVIDDLLKEYHKEKEKKKREKLYEKAIVFGVPNGSSYSYLNYKQPLKNIPVFNLQKEVDNIKAKHIKGKVVFLNTNFAELGINV